MAFYNALLIDPDMATRNVLKQGISSVGIFDRVFPAKTVKEGTAALEQSPLKYDVVFLSERIGAEHVKEFIRYAQDSVRGRGSAYVIVLRSQGTEQGELAASLLAGADGFLCEPFSVENIRIASESAVKVRQERKNEILRNMFGLLVGELINEVNRVAFLAKNGRSTEAAFKRLQSLLTPLDGMDPDSIQVFVETMCTMFPQAKLDNLTNYQGVSGRVKKMLVDRLEKEAGESPEDLTDKHPWLEGLKNA